jgi:GTP pyrophosphokinase
LSEEDKKLIRKAFDVSVEAHKNNEENQGGLYFPSIAVAKIVASEIGLRLRLPQHYYMMLWKTPYDR